MRVSPVSSPKRGKSSGEDDEETNFSYSPLSSAMGSPQKSTGNLDFYTGSPNSHGSRRSTDSSTMKDPPPPYSSPSKSVVSNNTQSASRYSSLMQFLDKEIENTSAPKRGGSEVGGPGIDNDNVTTVSSVSELSPNSKSRGGGYGSKSSIGGSRSSNNYIWDDHLRGYGAGGGGSGDNGHDDDNDGGVASYGYDDDGPDRDAATYFSHQAGKSQVSNASDLSEVVDKIKEKVEATRGELSEASRRAKELQAELVRVNAARKRRAAKLRGEWEQRLEKQRDEHESSSKRVVDFVSRLEKETEELRKKKQSLQEKKDKIMRSREQTLQLLQEDAARKAAQTRRQWQVEEKTVFDKVLSQRIEAIKKQAAQAFGPEMDKMVEEGKLELRKREDDIEERLERHRAHLQSELDRKLSSAKEAMREQLKAEDDRQRRSSERKLEETMRTHGAEMETVKEKFARDRKTLEESFERTRRLNAESALDAMREVRQSESKQVMELMAANQRELGQITSQNADSIKQTKLRLAQEEQEHLDRVVERMNAQVGMKKEKERVAAKAQAVAETERVLERLRDDVMSERRRVKEGIDKELDDLRLSHHASMESKLAQEKRMVERIAAMRGEVESYRSEIRMLEEQRQDKKDVLVDSKNRLSALRTELRQVEDEVDNTELRNNEELNQHQRKCSREYQQLVEEEASTKEAFHREEVACANRRDDAVNMYAADLNRIKDKVGGLLKRKDETARSLRQQLATLQDKSSELQDALDRVRAEQYSRVTSSVDGGNEGDDIGGDNGSGIRDIFQRLNIGNIDPDRGARMNSSASTTTYSTRGTSATAGASRASRTSRTSNRDRDDVSFRV